SAPPPPIRPAGQDGVVARLARAAYEERTLPAGLLDPARRGVLADALEENGCGDAQLLGHLRGPGPHVRGCFAVDLLGKEGAGKDGFVSVWLSLLPSLALCGLGWFALLASTGLLPPRWR